MPPVAYTVVATLPDESTAQEYLDWLRNGHVAAVIRAGASEAIIVRVDDPATPIRVEIRYRFPSREALDRYVRESAPALRAEGLARFPASRGVHLARAIGRILS